MPRSQIIDTIEVDSKNFLPSLTCNWAFKYLSSCYFLAYKFEEKEKEDPYTKTFDPVKNAKIESSRARIFIQFSLEFATYRAILAAM